MGDFEPTATVIADSISPVGKRLTTFLVTMHRFVLPEFNTHRAFSRNSASSRAIPTDKIIARITTTPAVPLAWSTARKGMAGGPPLTDQQAATARHVWIAARDTAIGHARTLLQMYVHKSVVNRLLEPFMDHTVVITSTPAGLTNFFETRSTPPTGEALAQPELVAAADAMRAAYWASDPIKIPATGIHLPFVSDDEKYHLTPSQQAMISAARCARTSYLTHDGIRDVDEDVNLYQKLITATPPHLSPLEHVALPAPTGLQPPGNFDGWQQLRHLFVHRGVEQK